MRLIHHPLRPARWQALSIYLCTGLLTVTGLAWLLLFFFFTDTFDAPDFMVATVQTKLWMMRLHGLGALWACVLVGSLIPLHMTQAWQRTMNVRSGVASVLIFSVLGLTGYALWYAPVGTLRQYSAWLHWALGLLVPMGLWLHVKLGRHTAP
jgi:hypothetical protein